MPDFDEKILWTVFMRNAAEENKLLQHAQAAGATAVAVRTSNLRIAAAIGRFHAQGIKVYAWRWPACRTGSTLPHYYAIDQANYVANTLIPAGLDGYFPDIESDNDGGLNDWDRTGLGPLAAQFCTIIRDAAPQNFVLALTSGAGQPHNNPNIPWQQFVQGSDYLLPQTYWRMDTAQGPKNINGGTPAAALARGDQHWAPIAAGRTVVPMLGELAVVTPAEIASYGALLVARGEKRLHVYTDTGGVQAAQLAAIAAL
jgi:hypothetical protein